MHTNGLAKMPLTSHSRPHANGTAPAIGARVPSATLQSAPEYAGTVEDLRHRIVESLQGQGFKVNGTSLGLPTVTDKPQLRQIHNEAVRHNRSRSRPGLAKYEPDLLVHIADGSDIAPEDIRPSLVRVEPRSEEELLFRYVRLHWSIPVSAGYGRRIRFLVRDESNGKLIGIIGLGDPVFGLRPRDEWIGWDYDTRRKRLRSVMDLFVLGAVPPYTRLLCGKLVAMLATSRVVTDEFQRKYGGRTSYISGEESNGHLALLTTTSALGRSSVYNRLRCHGGPAFVSVGYTSGSGDFHFCNGVYRDLRKFALKHCHATAKQKAWGNGFRNRRELVRKTLPLLGLSTKMMYHGIKREIFVIPLAKNTRAYLQQRDGRPQYYDWSTADIFAWFRERWLLPRAERDRSYLDYRCQDYRLWGTS